MSGDREKARGVRAEPPQEEALEVAAFCARPACRSEFRRVTQPGRRQAYCSELCRWAAEKDVRQLRARLAHFESVVEQARIDLAAHGRADDDPAIPSVDARSVASLAVARASGVLRFAGGSNEPLAEELRNLHDAVAPLLSSGRS